MFGPFTKVYRIVLSNKNMTDRENNCVNPPELFFTFTTRRYFDGTKNSDTFMAVGPMSYTTSLFIPYLYDTL